MSSKFFAFGFVAAAFLGLSDIYYGSLAKESLAVETLSQTPNIEKIEILKKEFQSRKNLAAGELALEIYFAAGMFVSYKAKLRELEILQTNGN
jgi:hypothetical protein